MRQTQMDPEQRVEINSPKSTPRGTPLNLVRKVHCTFFLPLQPQHSDAQQKTQNSRRRMKSREAGVGATKGSTTSLSASSRPSDLEFSIKKCQPRLRRGWIFGGREGQGVPPLSLEPSRKCFAVVASVHLTRHYRWICSLGMLLRSRLPGKPDSNTERRSSLHVNQGDFTLDWLECLNTPGTFHYELWLFG